MIPLQWIDMRAFALCYNITYQNYKPAGGKRTLAGGQPQPPHGAHQITAIEL